MKFPVAALALASIAIAAPATAQQAAAASTTAAAQPQPSAKARAAILALQTAVNAHDTASIPAKLAAAQAVASTPGDRYWIARQQLNAAVAENDLGAARQAVDAIAATNAVSAQEVAQVYSDLGGSYLKSKQYDAAVSAFERASALVPTDTNAILLMAQARSDQGRKADAAALIQRAIQLSKTSGQKPSETLYRQATSLAYGADSPASVGIARDWLAAYPSEEAWRNSIGIYRNINHGDEDNLIDVMRLTRVTNSMQTDADYEIYAGKAIDQANFGEAKAVLDEGIASGKLKASDPLVTEFVAATKGKVPSAADLSAAEKGAVAPQAFLRVGDRYYAAGDYAKAASLYRQALAKGVDANLANLRLGEALARSGDKAGATAALKAVSGTRSDLAQFWLLYVQTHA